MPDTWLQRQPLLESEDDDKPLGFGEVDGSVSRPRPVGYAFPVRAAIITFQVCGVPRSAESLTVFCVLGAMRGMTCGRRTADRGLRCAPAARDTHTL